MTGPLTRRWRTVWHGLLGCRWAVVMDTLSPCDPATPLCGVYPREATVCPRKCLRAYLWQPGSQRPQTGNNPDVRQCENE